MADMAHMMQTKPDEKEELTNGFRMGAVLDLSWMMKPKEKISVEKRRASGFGLNARCL